MKRVLRTSIYREENVVLGEKKLSPKFRVKNLSI